MALAEGGGAGAEGGTTKAVTRLAVVDPHLVIMMRDVMDSSETARRLKMHRRTLQRILSKRSPK
jgi:ActR/RegA family two-component response regulator